MLMVIMGGGATLWGPCVAAAVIVLIETYVSKYLGTDWPLFLGGLFVLSVVFLPAGSPGTLRACGTGCGAVTARKAAPENTAGGGGEA